MIRHYIDFSVYLNNLIKFLSAPLNLIHFQCPWSIVYLNEVQCSMSQTVFHIIFAWLVAFCLLCISLFFFLSDRGSRLISWNSDSHYINSCCSVKIKFSPKTQMNRYEAGSHNVDIQCKPSDLMDSWMTFFLRTITNFTIMHCLSIGWGGRAWIPQWINTRRSFWILGCT